MALKHLFAAGLSAFSVVQKAKAQQTAAAPTCTGYIAPRNGAPLVAPGFRAEIVADGLRSPRGIMFDREGGLLVVEQGHGISRLRLSGSSGCVSVEGDVQRVVEDESVSLPFCGGFQTGDTRLTATAEPWYCIVARW